LPLVHFSTDYVFDGSKGSPYVEVDIPIPLNVYGNSKLSGENFIRKLTEKHFIIRVSGLYGHSACRAKGGLNFVGLMLKLAEDRDEIRVVNDEILSPTFTYDIAVQLEKLTGTKEYGLYHMTSRGSCSWYEFAEQIFHLTDARVKLSIALPEEFSSKVPRPKYSVLENANLMAKGMDIMPHWSESLKQYLQEI
jgi:dTDP-4-dehydrorhamnose reductase